MLVSTKQNQTKTKRFLNDLRRNVINSQNLNNVKNLRATWVNKTLKTLIFRKIKTKNEKKKFEKKNGKKMNH